MFIKGIAILEIQLRFSLRISRINWMYNEGECRIKRYSYLNLNSTRQAVSFVLFCFVSRSHFNLLPEDHEKIHLVLFAIPGIVYLT